ncbi:uncharacterized protein TNCT_240981 [Trichonephila clavata]|uniref:Pre-C2HC domain-containing protein n=1 Tax=Trichonephila clavata TaxID=2740835 RepID=A0A8X6HX42_TRICU|nr:uncharacterized protein TNCT_240981 [Trichonephila clavata]
MTSIREPESLVGDSSDQCVVMEDISASTLTEEQRCTKISGLETQIQIFDARKDYVLTMIEIDKRNKHPLPETMPKLEGELKFVKEKIIFLEGKLNDSLPCPVPLCNHNFTFKPTKRHAEPIVKPAKLKIKNKSNSNDNNDFIPAKRTVKPFQEDKQKLIATDNKFAVLDTVNNGAEDVTPAPSKIKLITMKLFKDYNLILQQIHKTHPTATNTHINGFIKIQPQTPDHHREITEFLATKKVEYFVTDPLANRPLKLVIKGLPASTEVEEIKTDLLNKGIAAILTLSTPRGVALVATPEVESSTATSLIIILISMPHLHPLDTELLQLLQLTMHW